jgi:uncharacterized phage-associated protein
LIEKCLILAYIPYMPGRSPEIANEFIRRAAKASRHLTHMQLQKLVYIAHGWNLAINGTPLTLDTPSAWDYGPVYRDLFEALRGYGSNPVTREIRAGDFGGGVFLEGPDADKVAQAALGQGEKDVIDRVFRDYGQFHAYNLSALTHQPGTPWDQVYKQGVGKMQMIDNERVRRHFIELARSPRPAA